MTSNKRSSSFLNQLEVLEESYIKSAAEAQTLSFKFLIKQQRVRDCSQIFGGAALSFAGSGNVANKGFYGLHSRPAD
jgi:hypothetical protein